MSDDILTTLKIIIIGSTGVGKTCLLERFCNNTFTEKETSTLGAMCNSKYYKYGGDTVKLELWDTAGQECFNAITPSFFRGVQGVLLVFDITNLQSFRDLYYWIHTLKEFHDSEQEPAVLMVAGNKFDLQINQQVIPSDAALFARRNEGMFSETSAKTGHGVQEAFDDLIDAIMVSTCLWTKEDTKGEAAPVRLKAARSKSTLTCGNCVSAVFDLVAMQLDE